MQELTITDIKDYFKRRPIDANKGNFGKSGIIGGSKNYIGALKLASLSLSTLKSGAGIVRVIVKEECLNLIGPNILEQTLFPLKENLSNLKDAITGLYAIAIGMGMTTSDDAKEILNRVIHEYDGNLIIDADGLNILSENLNWLNETKAHILLTPHLKEASRLTQKSIEKIKSNPEKIISEFALKYHIIFLLKGSTTLISDGTKTIMTSYGCAGMATAGSGDVLSGVLAGILGYNDLNLHAVAAGTILTGIAGMKAEEKYTDIAMIASNTIEFIPEAIKKIRGEELWKSE